MTRLELYQAAFLRAAKECERTRLKLAEAQARLAEARAMVQVLSADPEAGQQDAFQSDPAAK